MDNEKGKLKPKETEGVLGKEVEQIQAETKILLDKFSKALEKVKAEESNVERDEDRREESNDKNRKRECDSEFRKIMFENAPTKDEDFIITEKKTW